MRTGFCLCGCGQQIVAKSKGAIPKWLPGHGPTTICECGCGEKIIQKRTRRFSRFLPGHVHNKVYPYWVARPDSTNLRTAREQSRKSTDVGYCKMNHIGGCKGFIEVHHIDGNPLNRDASNLIPVCRAHHRLIENKTITLDSKEMPDWYDDSSGKRRYRHTYPNARAWKLKNE